MEPTYVGSYTVQAHVDASCTRVRPSKDDLFYRITQAGKHVSDHGDRDGALYAAYRLWNNEIQRRRKP
jgi:hypothetical protein